MPKHMIRPRKYVAWAIVLFSSVLLLVSCRSKMAVQGDTGIRLSGAAQFEAVIGNTPAFDSFSSRLRMTVPLKKGEYTINGTLRMQRDELIQISLLLPLIRTEAARIEITPGHILVIDRMNRRYASVTTGELREVLHAEVDFAMLQSFFSNAMFLPGKYNLSRKDYSAFSAYPEGTDQIALRHRSRGFAYTFLTSLDTNRLVGSSIETLSSSHGLRWNYANFVPVGSTTFPSEMTIWIGRNEKPSKTTMELTRLSVDKLTLTPAAAPERYERIELNDILNMLESL